MGSERVGADQPAKREDRCLLKRDASQLGNQNRIVSEGRRSYFTELNFWSIFI